MICQLRDPVHNFISLRDKELQLVNTRLLQRLRRIHQLALASLVYPGALHTRFDHSLGVTHVAGAMAETLGFSGDELDRVRLAALLHDVGHGPFSHVSEYALELYADRSTLKPEQKKEKIHELVTSIMIRSDAAVRDILGSETCGQICKLLGDGYGEPVLHSIVSGPLDADKQDYLLRDSLFCGVQYGVFDLHQLHRSLTAYGKTNERQLMIKPDGVHAVEQYALAKYYLTTNVYRHKVRLISDQMIVRAIVLGCEKDRIKDLKQLYAFDNTETFCKRYAEWDDTRFFSRFATEAKESSKCAQMLRRLLDRNLLKRVFSGRPLDFEAGIRDRLLPLVRRENKRERTQVEAALAEVIAKAVNHKIDPNFVIYHAFDVKSVKEMSRNDDSGILVAKQSGPVEFLQESTLFRSISEGFKEEYVEVYAPVSWKTATERQHICAALTEEIRATIEKMIAFKTKGATK